MTEQHLDASIHRLTTCRASVPAPVVNRAEVLDYVTDMLLELQTLADHPDCEMLVGLLQLAHREARDRSQQAKPSFKP